jgi:hypothetical protein
MRNLTCDYHGELYTSELRSLVPDCPEHRDNCGSSASEGRIGIQPLIDRHNHVPILSRLFLHHLRATHRPCLTAPRFKDQEEDESVTRPSLAHIPCGVHSLL